MVIIRSFECEKSNSLGSYHELSILVGGGETRLSKRNAKMLFPNMAVSWVAPLSSVFRDVHGSVIQCPHLKVSSLSAHCWVNRNFSFEEEVLCDYEYGHPLRSLNIQSAYNSTIHPSTISFSKVHI